MAERDIERCAVIKVLEQGEVICIYPENKPYPSRLMLHLLDGKLLHVVAAIADEDTEIIITAYYPDPILWEPDFKTKH
jgi:hypothetical protein